MAISDNLKVIRTQKNLTQKELGNLIHVSDKTISTWENGRSLPNIEMIKMLAKVFDVKYEVLVDGESKKQKKISMILNFWNNNRYMCISIILLLCALVFIFVVDPNISYFVVHVGLIFYLGYLTFTKSWWFVIATLLTISQFTDQALFYFYVYNYNPNIAAYIGIPGFLLFFIQIVYIVVYFLKKRRPNYLSLISNTLFIIVVFLIFFSFELGYRSESGGYVERTSLSILYMTVVMIILGINQNKLIHRNT